MDAISYPWELYIRKTPKWSRMGRGKMAAPDANALERLTLSRIK